MSRPVDPQFAEIAQAIYGDAFDPRELWELAKALDSADVHNDGDPQKKKHSKTAGLLVLGAAAEGVGTYRAGEAALKAVRTGGGAAGKAAKVGEAGLQAANLGVGLVAAHELAKKPKQTVAKGKHTMPGVQKPRFQLRPKVTNMTDAEKDTWKAARDSAGRTGVRVLGGAALLGGAAIGHHLGVKRGTKNASLAIGDQEPAEPVTKAFRVKPVNAVDQRRVVSLRARKPPMSPPLAKSADLTWAGQISKVDAEKRQVFGWCSLSKVDGKDVVDLQGDYVPLDEIEKSAYKYVIESRKGGDMHRRVSKFAGDAPLHTADLIESFVVTPDKLKGMGLAEDALPHGWWVGFKVNDEEQWMRVKNGERAGFSIHGTGQRRPVAA